MSSADRAAVIDAMYDAVVRYLAFRTEDATDATDLATVALDAALSAGCVLSDMLEQVGVLAVRTVPSGCNSHFL